MEVLSKEQLQRIEENRREAQRKRQQQLSVPIAKNNNLNNGQAVSSISTISCSTVSSKFKPTSCTTANNKINISGKVDNDAVVSGICDLISTSRFAVSLTGFNPNVIELLKSIPGRAYDKTTKMWNFSLDMHASLISKAAVVGRVFKLEPLPKSVVSAFLPAEPDTNIDINKIDPVLLRALLPFQVEGVKFGVSRKGRCLIADDMGLGKTVQALGVAHYFVEKWPLLIVCPSSMRFPWEEAIHRFLPSVNPFHVVVVTSGSDVIQEANVVIISYDLLKSTIDAIKRKRFGVIIFIDDEFSVLCTLHGITLVHRDILTSLDNVWLQDESHFIKNTKTARTKAAMELTPMCSHVILLSGTPALSRPCELYPQVHMIDPVMFKHLHEFGLRYCAGKKSKFGWDYSGTSRATELELLLQRKFMLRRLKSQVLSQLPSKMRKVVVLQVKTAKTLTQQLEGYAKKMEKQRGMEQRGTLLEYYAATASAKLEAVCEHVGDKLETAAKMLVFAHHVAMLDGVCELLFDRRVDHIRIDGATSAEARAQLCERFQKDPATRVAVLSIKAANSGITLTAAQLVIFAELFWNPGELMQAEDRAHRIGQLDSVVVEYLIAKGTADDYLWNLVQSKLTVLNAIGLNKDCFKSANEDYHKDRNPQATLDSFVVNLDTDADTDSAIADLLIADDLPCVPESAKTCAPGSAKPGAPCVAMNEQFPAQAVFEDAFVDDDVFDSVDLETIVNAYECKRPKFS